MTFFHLQSLMLYTPHIISARPTTQAVFVAMHASSPLPGPLQLNLQGPSVYHVPPKGAPGSTGKAKLTKARAADDGQMPTAVEAVLSTSMHVRPQVCCGAKGRL